MELDRIAGVEPAVDEAAVEDELLFYAHGKPTPATPWRIDSIGAADWAMRRLAEINLRLREYDDQIALWAQAKRPLQHALLFFEDRLAEWAIEQRRKTPSLKTFPTAHGTVKTRKSEPRIEITDDEQALAWARTACSDAIKVTEELRVSMLGDAVEIGQVVVAYESTNKNTGESERLPVPTPYPFNAEMLGKAQQRLGDGFVVDAICAPAVIDKGTGKVVPGLGVRDGSITATVVPLGL